ncbi:IS3 family transposase [Streptomyces sp. NPDC005774]|uniref:IS3 family transposase n=1 Tax=Streptomyces sp. NPDC005774 TaxID=3364728 RepID=UPI003690AC35
MICYRLIDENTAHHEVSLMARLLGMSRQGYYAWRDRAPSRRRREDAELTEKIRGHHERSHGTYGAPRIHADLREIDGLSVGRKRVARLMRKAGLAGVHRRTGRVSLTRQDRQGTAAPDLIGRDFTASAPNLRWTADITYVPTDQGRLYLAVIMDLFSRRIVGWAMADHMRTELVTDALAMAVTARRPRPGLVHHSDKGSQGGFKGSSQHLDVEVWDGTACRMDDEDDGASSDALAGHASDPPGDRTRILAQDR